MSNREEFEKWAQPKWLNVCWFGDRYSYTATQARWEAWQARQPEIDALNEKIESREAQMETVGSIERDLRNELARLKAENERLRNAAKPVIDYWFEDNEERAHQDDNKAFLELSNAYYRRVNTTVAK